MISVTRAAGEVQKLNAEFRELVVFFRLVLTFRDNEVRIERGSPYHEARMPKQTLEHHPPALVQRAHSGEFGMFDVFKLRAVAGGKNAPLEA